MKEKISIGVLIASCLLVGIFLFNTKNVSEELDDYIVGTIISVDKNSVTVQTVNKLDYVVHTENISVKLVKNTFVKIYFNGVVLESYPMQITALKIEEVERPPFLNPNPVNLIS